MKMLFRADCDRSIGTGHIFRCRQMADYFSAKGWGIHVLVNDNDFTKKTVMKYDCNSLLFSSMSEEIAATEQFLLRTKFDVIVVDFADKNQNADLMDVFGRYAGQAVVAITDAFNPVKINADILIASHPKQTQEYYPQKAPIALTGERYMIVSPEFSRNRIPVRKEAKNVLISFGGHDPDNVSRKVAQFIAFESEKFDKATTTFHFLIGGIYRFEEELRQYLCNTGIKSVFHKNLPSVIPLFNNIDIAITAGGNTMYELCHMGIPCIAVGLNERQHEACLCLKDKGLIKYAGFHNRITQTVFAGLFNGLMTSDEQRIELHNNCVKHFNINTLGELYSLLTTLGVRDGTAE